MPITKEVLHEQSDGVWPDPKGEIIKVVRFNERAGTLVVLTERSSAPIDGGGDVPLNPTEHTVAEIKDKLDEYHVTEENAQRMLELEEAEQGRKTAIQAIQDATA